MTRRGPRLKIALALVGIMTLSLDRAAELAAPVARRPVTVMLVLDTSLSVRGPDFDSVGGAMVEVQENLALVSGEDRDAIAAYLKAVPPQESASP